MLLYLFATFCITLVSSYNNTDLNKHFKAPKWPHKFTIKATKMSLLTDLVMDMQVWKTDHALRVDFYGNTVTKMYTHYKTRHHNYIGYEIHPETNRNETAQEKCYKIIHSKDSEEWFESFNKTLPEINPDEFSAVGIETILDKKTVKFESIYMGEYEEWRETIWASPKYRKHGKKSVLIPVRYELKTFKNETGSLITHEIWDFYNFSFDFRNTVFRVPYRKRCIEKEFSSSEAIKFTTNSDKAPKDQIFVDSTDKNHIEIAFNKYIADFGRQYAHEEERTMRKSIFEENLRMVEEVNRKNLGYKLSINKFSDRTPMELKWSKGLKEGGQANNGSIPFPYNDTEIEERAKKLPEEYDARLHGLVNPIKSQDECGSCWAFSSVAAAEGALAMTNGGILMSLSEQAVIDCAWPYNATGCDGGLVYEAFEWMTTYGVPTVQDYGLYKNTEDFCHINQVKRKFTAKGYTNVPSGNINAMKWALVNYGPLAVGVHASEQFLQYSGGIFQENECKEDETDHVVTLIGYGKQNETLFWIIKNSYGTDWGNAGYMQIAADEDTCRVNSEPVYVIF